MYIFFATIDGLSRVLQVEYIFDFKRVEASNLRLFSDHLPSHEHLQSRKLEILSSPKYKIVFSLRYNSACCLFDLTALE
jgi:hypothetical protein